MKTILLVALTMVSGRANDAGSGASRAGNADSRTDARGGGKATKEAPNGEFVEATVLDVVGTEHGQHIVLLRAKKNGKVLPVWIGPTEALAISLRLAKRAAPRPLTHDLLERVLGTLKASIVKVQVEDLRGGTFLGRIFMKQGDKVVNLDSRPSDAIALALGAGAPIWVHRRVLETAGVSEADVRSGKGFRTAPPGPASKESL